MNKKDEDLWIWLVHNSRRVFYHIVDAQCHGALCTTRAPKGGSPRFAPTPTRATCIASIQLYNVRDHKSGRQAFTIIFRSFTPYATCKTRSRLYRSITEISNLRRDRNIISACILASGIFSNRAGRAHPINGPLRLM